MTKHPCITHTFGVFLWAVLTAAGCDKVPAPKPAAGDHEGHAAHVSAGVGALRSPDAPPPAGYEKGVETIQLGTLKGVMRYDRELIEVAPGVKVKLVLLNTDDMPHNLLLCKPGETSAMQVAALSLALGDQALTKNYVPETDLLLFATGLVNPGQSDALYFTTPNEEGDYPYVCTVPGHSATMRGVLRVTKTGGAGLFDLAYKYYEGEWNKLPVFSQLQPIDAAPIPGGVIDIGRAGRKDRFGFVFAGKLRTPRDGRYTFYLNSDDGSRLLINGKAVVDHDGLHSAGPAKAGQVILKAGVHAFELQYFELGGDELLDLSWEGPSLARRYFTPASGQSAAEREKYYLFVTDEPRVIRGSMPNASSKSIAVGLPGGLSYCFDAEACMVRYGWFGGFLDAGPDRGNGTGRGGQPNRPLGELFSVGAEAFPFSIGADSPAMPVFKGYTLTPQGPVFSYQWGPHTIKQTVTPAGGSVGLVYGFEIAPAPTAPLQFSVKPEGLSLAGSAGTWNGGTLTVAPPHSGRFSVTVSVKK